MMRNLLISSVMLSCVLASLALPANTQSFGNSPEAIPVKPSPATKDSDFFNRAKNLARQAAINANGGLKKYRPDPIMNGPAVKIPYTENADGSITFKFRGGAPGAAPSIETIATVRPDGVVTLNYNGPIQTANAPTSVAKDGDFFNRAKNLARQSAINANGGLERYRPDPIMNGPAVKIPYAENADGSITFKFRGGAPSAAPSIETIATVRPDGVVTLNYNGPIQTANPPTQSDRSKFSWEDEDSFLSRSLNLARQAAITANGGLARYRPEAAMFGPAAKSPHVKNPDGSLTFSFKGSVSGTTQLTIESVINVNRNGTVAVQYNGPIRQP